MVSRDLPDSPDSHCAIWMHVFTSKVLAVFEISKDVINLFCCLCWKRFSLFSLLFKFASV
jgi:hypothetical protein